MAAVTQLSDHTHTSFLPFLQTLHGFLLDLEDLDPPRLLSPPVVHHTHTPSEQTANL